MPTTKKFKVSYKCESKFVKNFLELNKYGQHLVLYFKIILNLRCEIFVNSFVLNYI